MAANDVILVGALVFVFALGFLAINFMVGQVTDSMINNEEVNSSAGAVSMFEALDDTMDRLDYVVFGLFIGLSLAVVVTGWFIGGYPIFMFLYFIVVVVGVVLSAVLSNVWEVFSQSASFGSTVVSFPLSNNLLLNLPVYVAAIGFLGVVVMFAKPYFMGDVV